MFRADSYPAPSIPTTTYVPDLPATGFPTGAFTAVALGVIVLGIVVLLVIRRWKPE